MPVIDLFLDLMKDPQFAEIVAKTSKSRRMAFTTFDGIFYPGEPKPYLGVAVIDPGPGKIVGPFSHLHPYTVIRRTSQVDKLEWENRHAP